MSFNWICHNSITSFSPSRLTLELFQNGKPFIEDFAPTVATCLIQVDAAVGTQPPAGFRTQRFDRDLQHDLLQDHRVQIDDVPFILREIEIRGVEFHLLL